MKKVLLSLVLCCMMLFLALPAMAADTPGFDLYFTTDKEYYDAGDTVTVQLILERNDGSTEDYGMFLFTDKVIYNTMYLEFIDTANTAEEVRVSTPAAYNATHDFISLNYLNMDSVEYNIVRTAKLVVTEIRFKALANTTGGQLFHDDAEVGLSAAELCDVNAKNGSYIIGEPEPVLYKVTFKNGGSSGSLPKMGPFAEGELFMLPLPELTKDGYEFIGWNEKDTSYVYAPGYQYVMPAYDVTFTAYWEEIPEEDVVEEEEPEAEPEEEEEEIIVIKPGQPQRPDLVIPFIDVPEWEWFYNDVRIAYHQGLINGTSAITYDPYGNLTIAAALKFAACMHQIAENGKVTLPVISGSDWYKVYVEYCIAKGIITADQFSNYNAIATRAQFAVIFANALPDGSYEAINAVTEGAIPDVASGIYGSEAIYKLYRAGITQGSGANHLFLPDQAIRRSEVAAILTRMMNEEERLSFTL